MKLSLNWIRDFVEVPSNLAAKKIGELITHHTAEVEEVNDEAQSFQHMVVGKVLEVRKHPEADRLQLVQVEIGQKSPIQIVCGGQNLKESMLVAITLPGAQVKWHGEGDWVEVKATKIRGQESYGMIAAGEEIGLEPDNSPESQEICIKDLSHLKAEPGTPLAIALGKKDILLDIDNKSLTHRPDLWGHYGFARELSTILKKPLKPLRELINFEPDALKNPLEISIKDPEICARFSACLVEGITIQESPQWIKTRLQAVGIRPINNVVDVTNYVMIELGQPMHAYDHHRLGSDELIVRYAQKGEMLETLDHISRELRETDPVVANPKGILGVAGIMGGADTEIRETTTGVLLEAAHWDAVVIRKSSTHHGLRSEASQRFEKSLDPSLTELAVERACQLLKQIDPKIKISPVLTAGNWEAPQIKIRVNPESVRMKIGADIPTAEMMDILEWLEFGVAQKENHLIVSVPSHRATKDVDIEEDVVEEIARIYGYSKIPSLIPQLPIQLPIENRERSDKHEARRILAKNLGFTEMLNYSFYNEAFYKKCGLENMRHIKVLNYLSEDQTHMRVSLIPGILKNIAQNEREKIEIKLFEIGHTYKEIGEFMPLEEKWIAAARLKKGDKNTFYSIKGAWESFCKEFRAAPYVLKKSTTPPPYAHPEQCLEIIMQGKAIGHIFTLHPSTALAFEIPKEIALFEVNFNALSEAGRPLTKFKPLPKFPSTRFDISVLVERKVTVEELKKIIHSANKEGWIEHVKLFDVYEGKNIPEGKKSLAFAIELRHPERTLNDAEFKAVQQTIFKAIEAKGGEIRGT